MYSCEVVVMRRTTRKPKRRAKNRQRVKVVRSQTVNGLKVPPIGPSQPTRKGHKLADLAPEERAWMLETSAHRGFCVREGSRDAQRHMQGEIADRRKMNAKKHKVGEKAWRTWWAKTRRASGDGVDRSQRPVHTGPIPLYDKGSDRYRR